MPAAVSILIGLTALTGRALAVPALTSFIPGAVQMKANTALCFLLSGVSLWILAGPTPRTRWLGQILSAIVAAVALTTLAEYVFGWNFGLDEWLVHDTAHSYNVFHGRMSPVTALALAALGTGTASLPYERVRAISTWGAIIGIVAGLVSLIGYLWNAVEIVTDQILPPVALNTATVLVLLGAGILLVCARHGGERQRSARLGAVEIKILAGFFVAMVLLLSAGTYTYRTSVRFADATAWVTHMQEVRTTLARIYGSVAGAEVAVRDYILTADHTYLDEYQRSIGDVESRLNALRTLIGGNVEQRDNLAALNGTVYGWKATMSRALTAYKDSGLVAARAVIAAERDANSTREVRVQVDRMASVEERFLEERHMVSAANRRNTLFSLLITLALACAVLIGLFRGIHGEMRARQEAERALKVSEQYKGSIIESSPDCLCVVSLDGRVQQMTPQGRRLLGIDESAAVTDMDWPDLWAPEDRESAITAFDAALSTGRGQFDGHTQTGGSLKWWDVIVMPVMGAEGRAERVLAVARDVTAAKRGESELRETNQFLDSLVENLPVIVVVKDAVSLRFLRVNRAFEKLLGFSRENLIGNTADQILPGQHEAAGASMDSDREALARGFLEIPEHQVVVGNNDLRTFHTTKLPIVDTLGRPQFLLAISTDITERKLAEKAIYDLNAALMHKAEELTASNRELESFSYSVSHDLRAPLRAVDGFALMLEEDCASQLNSEGRRYINVIRDNTRRMGELIDDLLEFSRLSRLPVAAQDINVESLVREVVADAAPAHPAVVEIGVLPPARGDRGLIRQVWVNLINNAIKYSSKTARPKIQVSGRQSADEVVYSVRDNGVGFSMEYADKLFRVFQRLHRADEFSGTGVGLAIVQRIVVRHGGRVWAEGKVNEGAEFSFSIPVQASHG